MGAPISKAEDIRLCGGKGSESAQDNQLCEIAKRHPKVPFSQTELLAYQAAAFSCTAAAFL